MKVGDVVKFIQPSEEWLAKLYGIVLGCDEHGRTEVLWSDGDTDYYMDGDGSSEMLEVISESR